MKKSETVYLKQIRDYIDKINRYIKDKDFKSLQKDDLLQDAEIRNLEIIGETANRLSKEFLEKHSDLPLLKAVVMRHKLIHDYDEINLKIVWNTIKKDLPGLRKKIVKILKE